MFSVKKAPFTDLNPNGRTPVIVDYNNDGFVLWEVWLFDLTIHLIYPSPALRIGYW